MIKMCNSSSCSAAKLTVKIKHALHTVWSLTSWQKFSHSLALLHKIV